MIEDVEEKDVAEALRKAREFADRVNAMAATMPPQHAERLLHTSNSMVSSLAMALDVLRRDRASAATGQPDQV
ncbi:MAG: hypothetical protein ABIR92_04130 [Gemmatimonadaceae bacterium]